jgi:hypothetical protein
MDILGYFLDILGYFLDEYQWISLMDMWLGYLWICLDISRISPVDIFSWISLKDILFCPKISKRYPFISNDIQRYPEISKWGELPDVLPYGGTASDLKGGRLLCS